MNVWTLFYGLKVNDFCWIIPADVASTAGLKANITNSCHFSHSLRDSTVFFVSCVT